MPAQSATIVIAAALLAAFSIGWKICLYLEAKKEDRLKKELAHHKKRIALMDATDLPKCKSVACYNCKHCAWLYNPGSTAIYLLGCGKDLKCKDFEFTGLNKPPAWERANEMARKAAGYPIGEEENFSDPALDAPLPLCHQE